MTTIYLGGPMQYSDDSESWRDQIISEHEDDSIQFIDPTGHINAEYDDIRWPQPGETMADLPEGTQVIQPEEIVYEDKNLLGKSDALLINLTETTEIEVSGSTRSVPVPSYGTRREHEYMACQLGRPVAIWYSEEIDRVPVWAMADTDFLSTSADDCVQFLKRRADQEEVSDLLT